MSLEGAQRGNPKSCVCLAMNESGQWEGTENLAGRMSF